MSDDKALKAGSGIFVPLVRALGSPDFWKEFEAVTGNLLAYDDFVVLTYRPDSKPDCPSDSLTPERRKVLIDDYLAGPFLLDPFYSVAVQTDMTGVHSVRSVAPDKFTSSRYFQLHYSRTGIRDELALVTRPYRDFCAVVSMIRSAELRLFGRREIERVREHEALLGALVEQHVVQSAGTTNQRTVQLREALGQISTKLSAQLTPRELEIAMMILRGHSSLSIACSLDIVEGTVKIHRKNIYKKLNISSQAELFSLFVAHMLETDVKA
ncbi:helix-turn-helix transcriptional regulator [Shinella pollutisoli]|uniref:LuxR C-terminal-related transcriptional regulator n=1 Tax=Shinella pollutisoli TaxID=2250594 RepID=A0ABV7DEB9_9HYPH|nr:helix-turn-helix transcriptional regulator [Shinella pollutisoli]